MTVQKLLRTGAVALGLALAACSSGDDPLPPFNPNGTSADVDAALSAFESPAVRSFAAAADDIDAAFSGSLVSASSRLLSARTGTAVGDAARRLSRSTAALAGLDRGTTTAAIEVLPPAILGTTFAYDLTAESYVPTNLTGAPANGVRFLLYAVNPVTGEPTAPLQEVGYADVIDEGNATVTSLRLLVVSGGTTYLDYDVDVTAGLSSGVAVVDGFVTNGVDRVNFDLRNEVSVGSGLSATLDYTLDVPTRDVTVDWRVALADILSETSTAAIDLEMSGPNGQVRVSGDVVAGSGVLAVQVNGEPFALITVSPDAPPVITDPSGAPLSPEAEAALRSVFDMVEDVADVFEDLLDPLDDLY